jgi:hypothetical protein
VRIGCGDVPDQFPEFLGDHRPARVPPAEAGPVVAEAGALPGEHGRRLDENQDFPPAGQASGQPGPQKSIAGPYARPSDRPVIERQLVSQRQNLQLEGQAQAEEASGERE